MVSLAAVMRHATQCRATCSNDSFPINPGDQPITGHLICLPIPAIHQPEIPLIDQRQEVTRLTLDDIRRPGKSLRLKSWRIVRRKNGPAVRAIPVHDNYTVAASLTLRREDRL